MVLGWLIVLSNSLVICVFMVVIFLFSVLFFIVWFILNRYWLVGINIFVMEIWYFEFDNGVVFNSSKILRFSVVFNVVWLLVDWIGERLRLVINCFIGLCFVSVMLFDVFIG